MSSVSTIFWVNPVGATGSYDAQGFAAVSSAQVAASVPERASMSLLAFGFATLLPLRRRRSAPPRQG